MAYFFTILYTFVDIGATLNRRLIIRYIKFIYMEPTQENMCSACNVAKVDGVCPQCEPKTDGDVEGTVEDAVEGATV